MVTVCPPADGKLAHGVSRRPSLCASRNVPIPTMQARPSSSATLGSSILATGLGFCGHLVFDWKYLRCVLCDAMLQTTEQWGLVRCIAVVSRPHCSYLLEIR